MGNVNAWNKIYSNFKKLYPRQARRCERYRPLDYPEIEIIFKDGTTMIYDDRLGKARITSSETIQDRMNAVGDRELYRTISEEDYARVFSLNVDEVMYRRNMKAVDLSESTGISYRTMRRFVNGEYIPDVLDALKIAEALDCPIDELILMR